MYTNLFSGMLVLALLLFGTLNEFCGAIMLVVASAMLMFFISQGKKIKVSINVGSILAIVFTILYFVSSIYALDRGMAVLGAIKNLWIIPALLCYSCLEKQEQEKVFDALLWFGSISVVIGIIGFFIPQLKGIFYSSGRLGGFFFYANTFAIFLLMCIIWMCRRERFRVLDYVNYVLLIVGIGLTGSRVAMVLGVAVIIFYMTRKKQTSFTIVSIIVMLAGVFAIDMGAEGLATSRLFNLSLTESTFVGRFLYARDVLPVIAHNPFGIGYKGFYYIQDSIQTGLYNVPYVHNDVLQIGLDIGIIPMTLYVIAFGFSLFTKKLSLEKKMMVSVLFLHGLFDYDLSFGSILFILLILLSDVKILDKEYTVEFSNITSKVTLFIGDVILFLVGIYFSIALIANQVGDYRLAINLLPDLTSAKLSLLEKSEDDIEIDSLSKEILVQNPTCSLAYYKAACLAQKNRDYVEMIRLERLAIANNHLRQIEYDKYVELLYYSILEADDEGKRLCAAEMNRIEGYMKDAMNSVSDLGKRINEQSRLHIRQTTIDVLEELSQSGYL